MRILVAARQGGSNGIETYAAVLARALALRGHEVIVAARSRVEGDDRGIQVVDCLPEPVWLARRLVGPFESVRAATRLRALADEVEADVVHVVYPEFAYRKGRPLVVTAWHPVVRPIRRALTAGSRHEKALAEARFGLSDRVAFRRARAIAAVSPAIADELRTTGIRATVVPPFLLDEEVRPSRSGRPDSCVLVARWLDEPRKGLRPAIQAVAAARRLRPKLELLLIGGWRDETAAERLPTFCRVLGVLPADGVRAQLEAAGCAVLSSVWEEFGYAGIEALGAGVPLACTPLHGYSDLGPADGVFAARDHHPLELARAIGSALACDAFDFPHRHLASAGAAALERAYDLAASGSTRAAALASPHASS